MNLVIEEKFPEVGVLLKGGREKGYILYEEIHTILSDEATAAPKDLEAIYARFFEVGIEIVTDPDRAARRRGGRCRRVGRRGPRGRREDQRPRAHVPARDGHRQAPRPRGRGPRSPSASSRARRRSTRRSRTTRSCSRRSSSSSRTPDATRRIVDELVNAPDEDDEEPERDRPRRPLDAAHRGHPRQLPKIGALDKDIKRLKFKARTIKKGTKTARARRSLDRQEDRRHGEADPRRRLHAGRAATAPIGHPQGHRPADVASPRSRSGRTRNTLKKEKNPTRIDFYKRRIAKYRKIAARARAEVRRLARGRQEDACAWSARARRRPTRPSTS